MIETKPGSKDDPRDPRKVVVEQGINPNPGPHGEMGKRRGQRAGGRPTSSLILLLWTMAGTWQTEAHGMCADGATDADWRSEHMGFYAGDEAHCIRTGCVTSYKNSMPRPPPAPDESDGNTWQMTEWGDRGYNIWDHSVNLQSSECRRTDSREDDISKINGNKGHRLATSELDRRWATVDDRKGCTGINYGGLVAATAITIAIICWYSVVNGKRVFGGRRGASSEFGGAALSRHEIVVARRISEKQPRLFDPKMRRAQRLLKAKRRAMSSGDRAAEHLGGREHVNGPPAKNCAGKRGCAGVHARSRRRGIGIIGWAVWIAVLLQTVAAVMHRPRANGDSGAAPMEGYNLLWTAEKRRIMIEHGARDKASAETTTMDTEADKEGSAHDVSPEQKDVIGIISANVHALGPRAESVALWDADVVLFQETKLAAHAIRDVSTVMRDNGWSFIHGKPCTPPKGKKGEGRTVAATEATSGGVAAMAKRPRRPIDPTKYDTDSVLHGSGRWMEMKTPIGGKSGCLTTACYYGVSGANTNKASTCRTRRCWRGSHGEQLMLATNRTSSWAT